MQTTSERAGLQRRMAGVRVAKHRRCRGATLSNRSGSGLNPNGTDGDERAVHHRNADLYQFLVRRTSRFRRAPIHAGARDIAGTIEGIDFVNPHAWLRVNVKSADGR